MAIEPRELQDQDVSIPIWHERKEDVTYATLPGSRGTHGDELIEMLAGAGVRMLGNQTKSILFEAGRTCAGTVYEVAILTRKQLGMGVLTMGDLRIEACRQNMTALTIEAACLTRIALSNERIAELGLRQIIMMHEPRCFVGCSLLLRAKLHGGIAPVIDTTEGKPNTELPPDSGFVFIASEAPDS